MVDITATITQPADITVTLDGGVINFLGLTDTPSVYTGESGKVATVNVGETALEFTTPGATWGAITGTLTDQTDLNTALGLKADSSTLTAHTGDGTIHFTQGSISIPASQISDFDTEVSNNSSVVANTSKVTNVSTNLSEGTSTETTVDVNSSDGTNATLVSASTLRAGLLTKAKFDEIVVNNTKISYTDAAAVSSNTTHRGLTNNPHTVTATQVNLGNVSNVATDDTAYSATSWNTNLDSATKNAIRDKIETMDTAIGLNTSKVTNATHTGDVTGTTTLTIGTDKVNDTHIDFGTGANQVSTADMPEQTNLYYTESRVNANTNVSANTTHRGLTTGNPHSVDKSDVGLSNVANVDTTNASNISSGTLSSSLLPPIALTTVQLAANQVAQLALTTEEGDVVVRTDEEKSYMRNAGLTGTMTDFNELQSPTDLVLSVNGETGTVILTTGDISEDVNSNYVSDAQLVVIGNTSNTNTGDQDISGIGTNTTAIAFNTTHRGSSGTDHSDVVTNTTHRGLTNNPHSVTATQVGLGNVSNVATSDTAYNATSWNTNLDSATKNAIRDKVETMDTAIGLNTSKVTNVTTNLSEGTNTTTTVNVNSSDGTNATLVSASTTRAGLLTKAKWDEIVVNNAKVTNVSTNLSAGTRTATTIKVDSSDGTDATLVEADTTNAGILGSDKWDEIVANTLKDTNVSTNLSEGTSTETTVDVDSSDGTNATLVAASTSRAGLLTKAKFDEIVVNNAKVTFSKTNVKATINHGATSGTTRPSGFDSVEWIGTVEPTNATNDDTWIDTT